MDASGTWLRDANREVGVPRGFAAMGGVEDHEAQGDEGGGGAEEFEEVEEFVRFLGRRDEGEEGGEGGGEEAEETEEFGCKGG